MIKTISGMNGVAAALKFFIEDATKNLFFVFPSVKRTISGIEVVRMIKKDQLLNSKSST